MNDLINLNQLPALDIDLDAELSQMLEGVRMHLPRIRIDHSPSGRHLMYVDYGPSLEEDVVHVEVPGNVLHGIVLQHQMIRAIFTEGETLPTCASVDGMPTVDSPKSHTCATCPHQAFGSTCKPKVRLLVLNPDREAQQPLLVFNLSPTSIKRWHRYVQRLARSKVPYLVVLTKFTLDDVKRPPYRYAEVDFTADRLVSEGELQWVKEARQALSQAMTQVAQEDFNEPGDASHDEA
jgi:hypothetical protein